MTDRLLQLIEDYQRGLEAFNAEKDQADQELGEIADRTFGPPLDAFFVGDQLPPPTTQACALAALQLAYDEMEKHNDVELPSRLVRAALAFFNRENGT